ncbi:hypothetical protein HELRODRAFT_158648 [Helobdella robusta]|uniref:Endonuclease/exonuclease/phosphatase domain-containing protein n=1 Tax=Helobdella robusta TaxID=6412 RepID=T1EN30_HELRO|nr:hypothetical protein HELRODRAFT_158648 [Helobdella robusta]ESO12186.1 hypothetical protein HELRODRAFT_158648 [Helobdella robusta]
MATYRPKLLPRKPSTNTYQIKKHDSNKLNTPFTAATWNVRTLYQTGKFENVKQEIKRMKLSILGLSETRWKKSGVITFEEDVNKSENEIFGDALTESAREVIPVKKQKIGQKGITDDIVSLMDERRKVKSCNPDSYKKMDKAIKKMCLEAKKKW